MIRLRVWVSGVVDCGRGVGEICRIAAAMVVVVVLKKEIVRIVVVMVIELMMMSRVDNLEWGVDA